MMAQLLAPQTLPVLALLGLISAIALRATGSEEPSGLASTQCTPVELLEEGTK
ncbi:hypothetical protein R3X27_11935 [Tropicimonas sp. TH_r6]|uniref:hypothetical protein n=1 Tax=Tropicimonas sp. TH_r6 TaxID=3082085 RepID=UPI00295569F1|nr:hypothetical protein [Tropicimonas sp. TH_r6]MDV7143393.1 hypothetical protein [Tropicimonas sp. TH_r6]